MSPHKLVGCLWLLAGLLAAQVAPSGPASQGVVSGVPEYPWKTADVVLVGELTGGILSASGARVRCNGMLQAHRVFKGDLAPGAQFPVAWEFVPGAPLNVKTAPSLSPQYGLWALERTADGVLRPLQFPQLSPQNSVLGTSLLEMPPARPSGRLAYPADATLHGKLASELAAGMESMAAADGDRLNPQPSPLPSGGVALKFTQPVRRFQTLLTALTRLNYADAERVYRYLSASPLPELQGAGIAGLLRNADAEAALALERDAPRLANAVAIFEMPRILTGIPFADNPAAAHALARAALGETELRGLETRLPGLVSSTRSLEFLPYFVVMLESPNLDARNAALVGFCSLLRPSSLRPAPPGGYWKPEMQRYCPERSLPDVAQQKVYVDLWKHWWDDNRQQIEADPAVPHPAVPARYRLNEQREDEYVQAPLELRFEILMREIVSFQRMRQQAPAGAPADPRPPGTPLNARLGREDDDKLAEIALRVTTTLDAISEKAREASMTAAFQGARMSPALAKALRAESDQAIMSGLADLKRELSPQGWREFEDRLSKTANSVRRVTLPPLPQPPKP
jgi:hypothetical protein